MSDIMSYNGSAIVCMAGKNCVAIASDTRFGVQHQTVATDMKKVFKMTDRCLIGMSGLITDVQTLVNKFKFRMNLYELQEERTMKPSVFANMVSSILYEKRFGPYFMEPIICGLEEVVQSNETKASTNNNNNNSTSTSSSSSSSSSTEAEESAKEFKPYMCGMDLLGAPVYTDDFIVAGTTSEELYGVCEAMFRKNMEPEDLFETISQCLLAAQDRDCLAGWGAVVHIMTPEGITTRELKARVD